MNRTNAHSADDCSVNTVIVTITITITMTTTTTTTSVYYPDHSSNIVIAVQIMLWLLYINFNRFPSNKKQSHLNS